MGITGSYFSELQELTSIPVGAQLIGGVNDILFRANPALLGGSSVTVSTATDLGGASTSDTAYPSQKAVKTYVDANSMSSAQLRYSPKAVSGATYTVIPADITDSGKVILLVSHTAPATVTISAPVTLLGGVIADHVGKSVNIRQAGTGTVTISGSTLVGTATTSTQHETKTLIVLSDNTWLIVGG